ncbi:MAG: patatin-like phospholipase family protein [Magnetococcales bacterium]|nr:patatin-like phospholipase family protein [Magnetococcales bacterium]
MSSIDTAKATQKPRIALVLQGGGALGAYHIGVYQAMAEAGLHPDWIAGISIGALTAAVLAGNRPEERVTQLEAFWDDITLPDEWGSVFVGGERKLFNFMSNLRTTFFGQPNFWYNRLLNPAVLPYVDPDGASYCDTSPMRETLRRRVNFDLLNTKAVRLSVGVTNVSTGHLHFFDNTTQPADKPMTPEHILASGSLPPGFPPTRVEGQLYWDGGCASNSPGEVIFQERDPAKRPQLLILVDLYTAEGREPTNMNEVTQRMTQIQYVDRALNHLRHEASSHNLRTHLLQARARSVDPAVAQAIAQQHVAAGMHIVHLVYHPLPDQLANSEAEFSRPSITERRAEGYQKMRSILAAPPWQEAVWQDHPDEIIIHHARKGQMVSKRYF